LIYVQALSFPFDVASLRQDTICAQRINKSISHFFILCLDMGHLCGETSVSGRASHGRTTSWARNIVLAMLHMGEPFLWLGQLLPTRPTQLKVLYSLGGSGQHADYCPHRLPRVWAAEWLAQPSRNSLSATRLYLSGYLDLYCLQVARSMVWSSIRLYSSTLCSSTHAHGYHVTYWSIIGSSLGWPSCPFLPIFPKICPSIPSVYRFAHARIVDLP
jgi:hypothetical protein